MLVNLHIDRIDHLVLTVESIEDTVDFYTRILGMEAVTFAAGRMALRFGQHKINLHQRGREFEPKAAHPVPGSADLCLLTALPLDQVLAHLQAHAIVIIEGPVRRTGAVGNLNSIYIRDPDGNLIEIANLLGTDTETST
ncbi:MAG: VOC family protein [Anaerolineae bacterium]|nr:VOC family protein [Anaerolineae bacterium]